VLIIRTSNFIRTASGIEFSISYRPVHTGRSLTEDTIPDDVFNTILPPDDEHRVARNM